MSIVKQNVELSCHVDGKDGLYFIRVDIYNDNKHITTLEYADITEYYKDIIEANDYISLYSKESEIQKDLAHAHLSRILNEPITSPNLILLLNFVNKMNHSNGTCGNDCIYCNPNLGDDPLADFTFNIKNVEHIDEV